MCWRICSAMKKKKLMTCSGVPVKRARRTGSWVAMPTAQVFKWHLRIMMQPIEMRGIVAKPNSSAPSRRGDDDVAAGLELAVSLHADAAAEIVEQQNLLGFGEAEFPGKAGVLDGAERRSAGAAGVAGDEHDIGVGLGDARRDGADADFRDELDGDARLAD